jgi:hypothetical protein
MLSIPFATREPAESIMERIILGAALVAILAACGTEAESREDRESRPATEEAPAQPVRPVQAGPEPTVPSPAPARAIQAGSLLTFEVREHVSSISHGPGDAFSLVLVDPVSGSGDAMLAAGTPARGVVTRVHQDPGSDGVPHLVIGVTSIEAGGSQTSIRGRVQSTAADAVSFATRGGGSALAEGTRIVVRLERAPVF